MNKLWWQARALWHLQRSTGWLDVRLLLSITDRMVETYYPKFAPDEAVRLEMSLFY